MPDVYTTNKNSVVIEKDQRTETQKIDRVIEKTGRKLFEISSVFPFDFFPDKIVIDENKVSLIFGIFFFSEQVFPIFIKDIKNVTVSSSILFASLTFELTGYEKNPQKIKYLWIPGAMRARRIITGLVACHAEKIDTTKLSESKLLEKVEEIGRARTS